MPRTIRTFLPVVGDATALAAAFEGDPQRWLPSARRDGGQIWHVPVRAGTLVRPVRASIGDPWRAGATCWRTVAWDPIHDDGDTVPIDRLLPSLDGELGLHLEARGRVTLVMDARYHPPGGTLGAAADAAGLRLVARGTVERFLEDVACRLSAEAMLLQDDAPAAAPGAGTSAAGHAPRDDRAPARFA